MSWLQKRFNFFVFFMVFTLAPAYSDAAVYVYEVITKDTTFQTASKLPPDAFIMYNGGEDVIFRLKILKIYADKDFKNALRDYGLETKNIRYLPHFREPNHIKYRPYYWWR